VPLLRDGLVRAETLVDVRAVVPRGIDGHADRRGTTLAELEVDPQIPQALREACSLAASPQLRSMGTSAATCCRRRAAGTGGSVRLLAARRRALLRRGRRAPRARDLRQRALRVGASVRRRAALLALGATLRTTARELPIAELYRLPTDDDRDHDARADELILELDVPAPERRRT
jgi:xanthine dehydrogenase YagS FAD-binding subunit